MRHIKYKTKFIILSSLLASISFILVPLIRFFQGNPVIPSGNSYGFLSWIYSYYPISPIINLSISYIILLFSLFLFSEISEKISSRETEYYIGMILFASLPSFIMSFLGLNKILLALFGVLLATYLYIKNKNIFLLFSVLLFLLAPIIPLIFLIFYLLTNPKAFKSSFFKKYLIFLFIGFILSIIFQISSFASSFQIPKVITLFTFFGANNGYSIIILIFGIIGLYASRNLKNNKYLHFLFYFIFVLSFVNIYLRVFSILLMTFLSATALDSLMEKKWTYNSLKYAIALLTCCILFFSLITSLGYNITSSPNINQVEALEYVDSVKSNYDQGYLLTDDNYASFIEYYSGLIPFYGVDYKNDEISAKIFYERRSQDTIKLINEANISFIMIDAKMTSGNVWANEREDLLFVLKHNPEFHKIYNMNGVRIYYFNQSMEN